MRASPDDVLGMAFFARVVEARSFSDAARSLGVSKSAVSTRVARLEEKLGVTLLHRTTRKIALTADGVRLYERCARVLAEADEAAQLGAGASAEPRGTLRIQAPTAFEGGPCARMIGDFLRAHPGVRVELRFSDHAPDFAAGAVDLALVVADRLTDSALTTRRIASMPVMVCASPAYLRARGIPFRPQDLVAHDCLAHALRPGDRDMSLTTEEGAIAFAHLAKLVSDDVSFLRSAALAGLGIAMLPEALVHDDVASGRIHRVLDDFRGPDPSLHVLHPHGRLAPAVVRAFVDHLAASAGMVAPRERSAPPTPRRRRASGDRIAITAQDVGRLEAVASVYEDVDAAGVARLRALIARAHPTAATKIPRNAVTMNARVRVRDERALERELSVVYPWDVARDRVSVLSELGASLLGATARSKVGAVEVLSVPYQPEAAGDHHL